MLVPVDAREVSMPATPPAVPRARQVIDVDLRRQVLDPGVAAWAREAATRYGDHGTTLLGQVQASGTLAQAGRPDASEGWSLVGRWLMIVTVLCVCAVAFASYANHAAR